MEAGGSGEPVTGGFGRDARAVGYSVEIFASSPLFSLLCAQTVSRFRDAPGCCSTLALPGKVDTDTICPSPSISRAPVCRLPT